MKLNIYNPKQALNKAYLKEKVSRDSIELFKRNLISLLGKIDENESEEHLKNVISDFLKDTWYKEINEINTKDRKDLVIHIGKSTKDPVGVILEVKKPSNKSEMMTASKPNSKALHELVLYYLRERIEHNNIDIKYLIVTNIYEWYIIDEVWFEKHVFRNSKLKKDYDNWRLSGNDTKFFYENIAKPFLETVSEKIECTYFDIREYENIISNADKSDDNRLISLFKIFSPVHLLKLPFANDSNSLDTKFYSELLHIIGLEEIKEAGKKIIKRKSKSDPASILENTIMKLEDRDCLRNITNISSFGKDRKEQVFNVALELSITWINRILFLKLLEAQLYKYHRGSSNYIFLNHKTIHDFDELNNLFFQVLAEKYSKRRDHLKEKFKHVPYLNSSLFERTDLERITIDISGLDNRLALKIHNTTVLKDDQGKRKSGEQPTLKYLFDFLDAYDFTSEGSEEIQEQNKNLINASVLGLIFEKINGYKDGSYFTPGFVTMYMCKETIRNSVIEKFNTNYKIDCESFEDLKNFTASKFKAKDILEFNKLINELKICDPAVGSGHFLVSALNEVIALKAELGILADREGLRLTGYEVKIENDELIVTYNDNTEIFEYSITGNSITKETQRVQETLFHEKETIIENCLFGVDINPNSVKICRLRLWIELLKNAYYTQESKYTELETLPNIDINIKCGNSLISRFPLDSDLKKALKGKWNIETYRIAVHSYHEADNKEEKRKLEELIDTIKKDFRTEIGGNDPRRKRLTKLKEELFLKTVSPKLELDVELKKGGKKLEKEKLKKLSEDINKLEQELKDIENSIIFENAFEWRFEFPEVLDNDGNFIGFDVILGNPPYVFGGNEGISTIEKKYFSNNFTSGGGKINLFTLFIEQAFRIMKPKAEFSFIIPNTFLRVTSYSTSRQLLIDNHKVKTVYDFGDSVFDDAVTTAIVIVAQKTAPEESNQIKIYNGKAINSISQSDLKNTGYVIAINIDDANRKVLDKLTQNTFQLGSICREMIFGVVITKNKDEVVSNKPKEGWKPFLEGKDIGAYFIKPIHSYLNYDPSLLHRSRTPDVFEAREKLLIQRITGGARPLKVAYDNKQYYNKESINNIILEDDCEYDAKYILGLLNSKLVNWYYTKQFTNDSRLTVNLSKEYLSQIPIAKANSKRQRPIVSVAEYLLAINEITEAVNEYVPNKHISSQFEEIMDALVFELYFSEDFEQAGIQFYTHVEKLFQPLKNADELEKSKLIHDCYQKIRSKENEIRNNLKLMDIRLAELVMPIKTIS